jgi:hypothetical protein
MQYKVELSHTTGKTIEEKTFSELSAAKAYCKELVQTTPHTRVLITLIHCPAPGVEHMLDVDFVEGVSLNPLYPPFSAPFASQPAANRKSDQP